jgi:hypothetical protein
VNSISSLAADSSFFFARAIKLRRASSAIQRVDSMGDVSASCAPVFMNATY